MRTAFHEDEWVIRDQFGDAWKLTIVRRGARLPSSPVERTLGSAPLRGLLFHALRGDFVYDVEIARDLLAVYDALASAYVSRELPLGYTPFVPRLPKGLGQAVNDRVLEAWARGELRVEPVAGARFIDLPRAPEEKPAGQQRAVQEETLRLRITQRKPEPPPQSAGPPPMPSEPDQHVVYEDPPYRPQRVEVSALANVAYELRVRGKTISGRTDGAGKIVQPIDPDAQSATLVLEPEQPGERTITVHLDGLDPRDAISGAKQRLSNIGYDCGDCTNEETLDWARTLEAFQAHHGLEESGELDDATHAKLRDLHEA